MAQQLIWVRWFGVLGAIGLAVATAVGLLPGMVSAVGAAVLACLALLLPSQQQTAPPVKMCDIQPVQQPAPVGPDLTAPLATLRAAVADLGEGRFSADAGDATATQALDAARTAIDEALALTGLMAAGDLSVRSSGAHPGEFAALMAGLDAVGEGLRTVIAALQDASADIANRSEALNAAATELDTAMGDQLTALESVRRGGDAVTDAVAAVSASAARGEETASQLAVVAAEGGARSEGAVAAMVQVQTSSREIGKVLDLIGGIAQQTKLLGVNAAVEAARAGEAGRGFAVVSSEVQMLAQRAADAAREIDLLVKTSDAAVAEGTREVGACAELLARIGQEMDGVTNAAQEIHSACVSQTDTVTETLGQIAAADNSARHTERIAASIADAAAGLDAVAMGLTERLNGIMLHDHAMDEAVRSRAAEVSRLFELGVAEGRITMDALFSTDYTPLSGANPPQFTTPYTDFTDAVLPPVLEGAFDLGPQVAFSAAVNRDGFLPTHNKRLSQRQGDDPVWNAAHCRNRRFFNDRVGLAAGRSTAPMLIQAYRRDMGGGDVVTMKDISAPIMVHGRHWGGLRIGYSLTAKRLGQTSRAA